MSSNPPSNLYTGDTIDKANIGHPTQQPQQSQPLSSSSSSGAQSSSQLTSSSAPSSSAGKEKEKEKHPPVMTDMSRKEEQHRSSGWGAPASRRLMVFVDGSPESDRAFYTALTWLREGDFLSSVYVVDAMTLHPIPAGRIALFGSAAPALFIPASSRTGAEEAAKSAREKVHRLIARYAAMAREVNAHNVQCVAVSTAADRSVKEEALHYAQQLKADVIFTGTRGQGAVKRFFLGSFANYLLNNSECDVMIVKGELHLGVPSHQARITAEEAHRALHERGGVYHGFAGYSYEESPSTGSRIPPPHGVVFGSGKQDPVQDKSTHEETTPSKSKAGEALPGTTTGEKSFLGPHKGLGMEGDKGIKGPSSEEVSRMEKTAVQIAGDKVPGFDKVPGIAPPHKAVPNPCDTAPEHHHGGGGGGGRPNSPH